MTSTGATAAREALSDDLAQVARGDRLALRRVYAATSAKLLGICLRITSDRASAEDAMQETYLKVWQRAGAFDRTRASPITWLCLIARGTAIDAARAARRRGDATGAFAEAGAGAPLAEVDRITLDDCLDRLEAISRDAILSAFFDGYGYGELAVRLNVPEGTMKSRIRRGLLALRRCLDDG